MRRLLRPTLYLFVAVALFHLAGGRAALRSARARWRLFQQPPTAEQMRVPVEPVVPLPASLPAQAVRGKMWLSEPPRPLSIAVVLSAILLGAVIAMFVTGRSERRA